MEDCDQIYQVLPSDDELLRRENIFLNLFDKYADIDEGSDQELMDDVDNSAVSSDNTDADSSCSRMSSDGTEDAFDVNEMIQRVQSIINNRVDAWSEKGINFQLKTVDRDVTVDEWLEANRECTTTTKKYEKTVVNDKNTMTTITTETTKTTTSRRSFVMLRNGEASNGNQIKAITNEAFTVSESPKNDNAIKKKTKKPKKESRKTVPDSFVSQTIQPPSELRKQSKPKVNRKVNRKDIVAPSSPVKIKRLLSPRSPQMKLRNQRIAARSKSKPKRMISHSEEMVANQDFDPADVRDSPVRQESNRSTDDNFRTKNNSLFKTRPQIVIYSPSAKEAFGTKIDDEFMSVKKDDFVKRIDPKYHQQHDFSLMEECIVPINQRIVYEPPSVDGPTTENDSDDSEIEDDLLTSYTRTGHFFRLNSKRTV